MTLQREETSDAELVGQAREGDRDAFGELVDRHQKSVYAAALAITRSHDDAQDVAQDSFLRALRKLESCRRPQRFGHWLLALARNQARNHIRSRALREARTIPRHTATSSPTPQREALLAALRASLGDALEGLFPIQREIVLLHDWEGWKHAEIAQRLGIPQGTVRSHLHFARKRLRAKLSSWKLGGRRIG